MIAGYTLYNMLQIDRTIFDNIMLYEKIDKEICICEIEKRCLSLTVNCDFPSLFKSFVELFFKKNYDIFRELWETKLYEYNPIENYDRNESSERILTNGRKENSKRILTNGRKENSKRILANDGENKVSAMNSSDYQPDSKTVNNGSDTFNATTDDDGSDVYNATTDDDGSDVYNARTHGNIGVTTTQAMIEEQRKVVRYDFYSEVARMFEDELCVSNYGTY